MKICPKRFINPKHLIEWEVKQGPDDPHPVLTYLAAGSVRVVHRPAYPNQGHSGVVGGCGGAAGGGAGYIPPSVDVHHDWRSIMCVSFDDADTLVAAINAALE